MTPEASDVYRIRLDKETFDPRRGRTVLATHFFYKHTIPLGSQAQRATKLSHESNADRTCNFGTLGTMGHLGQPGQWDTSRVGFEPEDAKPDVPAIEETE